MWLERHGYAERGRNKTFHSVGDDNLGHSQSTASVDRGNVDYVNNVMANHDPVKAQNM